MELAANSSLRFSSGYGLFRRSLSFGPLPAFFLSLDSNITQFSRITAMKFFYDFQIAARLKKPRSVPPSNISLSPRPETRDAGIP
ncbi:hypothetical protein LA080_003447 [Diaporthe eres]|nr:hypothetical protein LA080_003447 [Diaporthe eres]